jgi:uncharacterized membrane protein
VSFKGVLLEGLEVALIVVSFGSGQGRLSLAVVSATLSIAVVVGLGLIVRAPLSRVPENRIKFGVGLMLTSFGLYWSIEGAGYAWPGEELALIGILALSTAISLAAVRALRHRRASQLLDVAA